MSEATVTDTLARLTAAWNAGDWLFDGPLRGSRMTWSPDERDVRLLRPGVQPAEAAELTPDRASVQTTVLVESTGTWRVAAFHNTRKQPATRA
jgi:hypothetical protein